MSSYLTPRPEVAEGKGRTSALSSLSLVWSPHYGFFSVLFDKRTWTLSVLNILKFCTNRALSIFVLRQGLTRSPWLATMPSLNGCWRFEEVDRECPDISTHHVKFWARLPVLKSRVCLQQEVVWLNPGSIVCPGHLRGYFLCLSSSQNKLTPRTYYFKPFNVSVTS